jgi:hypothetical protein
MSGERKDYAVLISLMTREEAEIAAGALRADGVDAFIGNSNHAYTEWLLTPALGGLQVFVPRRQLDDAKQLLRSRISENVDSYPDDRVRRRDRWKLWMLLTGFYGVGWAYMLIVQWSWSPEEQLHFFDWIANVANAPLWR